MAATSLDAFSGPRVVVAAPGKGERPACLHCGLSVSDSGSAFCCAGCKSVYDLLHANHLDAYYDLRGPRGVPIADRRADRRDAKWLDALEARLAGTNGGHVRLTLDVQGLHCVACVWLIEKVFQGTPGAVRITVNPAVGRVEVLARPEYDLRGFVEKVERFGYLFGPPLKHPRAASSDLLWRLGLCVAITMNSMIFAIPIYAGLDRGPIFELFQDAGLCARGARRDDRWNGLLSVRVANDPGGGAAPRPADCARHRARLRGVRARVRVSGPRRCVF